MEEHYKIESIPAPIFDYIPQSPYQSSSYIYVEEDADGNIINSSPIFGPVKDFIRKMKGGIFDFLGIFP